MNSKQHGDQGLAAAIYTFTELGYSVCLPLTESQRFDLIVVQNNICFRVEVKHSKSLTTSGGYCVELRTKGGNKTGETTKRISSKDSELVFIRTPYGNWIFPTSELDGRATITLQSESKPEFKSIIK